MSKTKSSLDTEEQVAKFANGQIMIYDGIAEYESIPKCDRREYVMRLLALYQLSLRGATEREAWVNEARKDAETAHKTAKTLSDELDTIKASFWYRVYKFFA